MARLFAHWTHYYTHFDEKGRRVEYVIPGGEWREVPQDVADLLATAAPQKLVILGAGEERPGQAAEAVVSEPEAYETREIEAPTADRMATPKRRATRRTR